MKLSPDTRVDASFTGNAGAEGVSAVVDDGEALDAPDAEGEALARAVAAAAPVGAIAGNPGAVGAGSAEAVGSVVAGALATATDVETVEPAVGPLGAGERSRVGGTSLVQAAAPEVTIAITRSLMKCRIRL